MYDTFNIKKGKMLIFVTCISVGSMSSKLRHAVNAFTAEVVNDAENVSPDDSNLILRCIS